MSFGYVYCRGEGCGALIWAPPGVEQVCPECRVKRAAEAAVRVDEALASAAEEVTS